MTEARQQVDLSAGSVFRALLIIIAFGVLYLLSDVLIILIFAIVIASAVQPFVAWFERRRVPRIVSVLLLYLMVVAAGVILSTLVFPSVSGDLTQLTSYLPKITKEISTSLDAAQSGNKYFDFISEIQNILEVVTGYLQQFSQSALNLAVSAFGGIFSFVAILVISFYLSVMKNGVQNFLEAVVPERYEKYVLDLWRRTEYKVGLWLQGQMLLSLIMGLVVFVGLTLMGVKFALMFAILIMVLEIVPIAGPVLAAIPAILIAFLQSPELGLYTLIFYIVAQQLENHLLVPFVLGKTIGLNPIVVILAILVGSKLAGLAGAFLGVPVATIIVEIIDDMARSKSARRTA